MNVQSQDSSHQYSDFVQVFGKKYIKSIPESQFDFIEMAQKGVPANAIACAKSTKLHYRYDASPYPQLPASGLYDQG